MERAGIPLPLPSTIGLSNGSRRVRAQSTIEGEPVAAIMSLNVHRRHLSKQERADAIVAWVHLLEENKPGQVGPVSEAKGGRGKRSPLKEQALAINAELPKEQQVSERTIKRSIAKAEGKTPKPKAAPVEEESDDDDFVGVAHPAEIAKNLLHSVEGSEEVARAWRKVLKKASTLDQGDKERIDNAINRLINKWRLVQSTLKRASQKPQDGGKHPPRQTKNWRL
jgi:hypothetical protein